MKTIGSQIGLYGAKNQDVVRQLCRDRSVRPGIDHGGCAEWGSAGPETFVDVDLLRRQFSGNFDALVFELSLASND